MKPGAELILDEPMSRRARSYFEALRDTAPSWVAPAKRYTGARRVVVVYGAGASWRQEYLRRHMAAGGRSVLFDLAYWDRTNALRVSLDGLHPTKEHLNLTHGRAPRRVFQLRDDHDPSGHVLLVGVGHKTTEMHGEAPRTWERKALRRIRAQIPDARVMWRPKGVPAPLEDLDLLHGCSIEDALRGARLAVCRASNVAVDACAAGVPVWCEGGAAAVLYTGNARPCVEERRAFLHALSWWEWQIGEAADTWGFIEGVIRRTGGGV